MEIQPHNQRVLGMSPEEALVLTAVQESLSGKVSAIARYAKLPRTTVAFLLQKLCDRGFVKRVSIRNHAEWMICPEADIADRLKRVMRDTLSLASQNAIVTDYLTVEVFDSEKNIELLARRILRFHKNDRVYYIQCADSANYQMKELNQKFMRDYHWEIKDKKLVMETIGPQHLLDVFKDLSFQQLAGHHGRFIVAHVVPNQFIQFPGDVLICRDTVIIIDYAQGRMIHIQNTLIAHIFLHLFELIKLHAKHIDLNAYILRLMEKRRAEQEHPLPFLS